LKVALIHYWLVAMRGGERVLEALCELYPDADIFTHVYRPDAISDTIRAHRIHETAIGRLPRAARWYPYYLPLMPLALEALDLRAYDLVISSESGPAKGVITAPDSLHVCYCHSPMRYLWDMQAEYFSHLGSIRRLMMAPMMNYLRLWDYSSAARVDHFIANSRFVASRIQKYYRRESKVIHPPVDTQRFSLTSGTKNYYLAVGQLVPYKRFDLAVEAFNRLGAPLHIVGDGTELTALKRKAKSNIHFLGPLHGHALEESYAGCRALIFPGTEDFGIVPVEAMASGRPVIAYARGGALESVIDGRTGFLFASPNAESLTAAVRRFESDPEFFDAMILRRHAQTFDTTIFKEKVTDSINQWGESSAAMQTSIAKACRVGATETPT
jgi:glycosyltransferase involved in cell wall biosynthesis